MVCCGITCSSTFKSFFYIPQLVDFRFTKRMDGSYCFTICGNPLYFAPEFVVQQGYDYSADIWAFGVTLFELFEGTTPFGNNDTEETSIFRSISGFSQR
ncbi:hypothetical protein EON65_03750 [archaeon]|nr:MAG: hypothetical protein EON65_03750 [archaeon]